MKKPLAALLLLWAAIAQAAPPSADSIKALLDVTRVERTTETLLVQLDKNLRQMAAAGLAKNPNANEAQRRLMEGMPEKVMALMREELGPAKMRPMQIQVYQELFTQEEVDALTAFYKSPAGTAMIEKMPLAMQRSSALMQQRMQPLIQRMQAETMEALEAAKKP